MGNPDVCLKILAVERILKNNPQGVTIKQIIEKLDNHYGIKAERKSILRNIATLTRFMPIYEYRDGTKVMYCLEKGWNNGYF